MSLYHIFRHYSNLSCRAHHQLICQQDQTRHLSWWNWNIWDRIMTSWEYKYLYTGILSVLCAVNAHIETDHDSSNTIKILANGQQPSTVPSTCLSPSSHHVSSGQLYILEVHHPQILLQKVWTLTAQYHLLRILTVEVETMWDVFCITTKHSK